MSLYIADFHIHSKYSRATSKQMDLKHLDKWAKIKGIQILGTGDFTHPIWFKELKEKLQPAESGIYQLKSQLIKSPSNQITKFLLTTEISCIYSKGGKVRRIHLVVFAPDLETVEKINRKLESRNFNLTFDGRPILGLDAKELVKILLDISPEIFIVPAHVWTPWYSIFGSKSGFNSIEECFEELTPYIFALETGLSSDPAMNWRWSYLDKYTLISNSDAHSPENLGREANVFSVESGSALAGGFLSYKNIIKAIKLAGKIEDSAIQRGTNLKLVETIEFFPEEGKYHFDGHRLCGVCLTPEQTKKEKGICPKCHRPLTLGVMYRVQELADRPQPQKPVASPGYKSIIPLKEIIAEIIGQEKNTKSVAQIYDNLIKKGGNEFNILLNFSQEELNSLNLPNLAEAILKMRQGQVIKKPGYDGVYGKIRIFSTKDRDKKISRKNKNPRQRSLF